MVFDKKTKRDVVGILGLGVGLGVGTAIEAKVSPAVPVFTQFAPVVAVVGPLIGARILLRQVNRLPTATRPIKIKRRRGLLL